MPQTQALATTRLADQLERGFQGGAWHGLAVMELLAGVDERLAQWRPGPTVHAIAELVGHLTYWLEDTRRRLLGELPSQGEPGSDWGPPQLDAQAWGAACAALEAAHGRLRAAILQLPEGRLDEAMPGSDSTIRGLVLGILQHNAYHAGQIALLRKLAEAGIGGRP